MFIINTEEMLHSHQEMFSLSLFLKDALVFLLILRNSLLQNKQTKKQYTLNINDTSYLA